MSTAEARREIRNHVVALNELNQRVFAECHLKCIPKPRDGDLSIAEMVCIDRCVPKYLSVMEHVAKELATARGSGVR
jgi:Tim10/DDP family zinc finger